MDPHKSNYNPQEDQTEPLWSAYTDRVVGVYSTSGGIVVLGVLRKPNFDSSFVSFIPSIIFEADEEHCYVDYETPTRLPIQMFGRGETIVRPLAKGYLEEKVKIVNNLADKRRSVLGFSVKTGKTASSQPL